MKHFLGSCCIAALASVSFASSATELTVASFEPGVMPVLVSVDKHGDVTRIQSSQTLKPSLNRLLRKNLKEMITGPGVKDDQAINTQIVLRMTLKRTPLEDGRVAVSFVPVDGKVVPKGAWAWKLDGGRYALVDATDPSFRSFKGFGDPPLGPSQHNFSSPPSQGPSSPPSTSSAPSSRGS